MRIITRAKTKYRLQLKLLRRDGDDLGNVKRSEKYGYRS
jgi:hypothetical protein